jgi:hypothetical protein
MGVTFCAISHTALCFSSISLAWHVLCASVQPGRVVVRARSCRNGARILDVADPCDSSIGKISAAMTAACPLWQQRWPRSSRQKPKSMAVFT